MFDELVGQVRRLFSSKSNGGRLVYCLPDRLHFYKQLLLATSIILLLGYANFRAHFECQGTERISTKTLTNFCWINGTTTLDRIKSNRNDQQRPPPKRLFNATNHKLPTGSSVLTQLMPHVGMHFKLTEGRYEIINHNYMRSLWALLIMMAVCSYFAQRKWAQLFQTDLIRALLQLPGSEKLPIVVRAQQLKPYEMLTKPDWPAGAAAASAANIGGRHCQAAAPRTPTTMSLNNGGESTNSSSYNSNTKTLSSLLRDAAAAAVEAEAAATAGDQSSSSQLFMQKIDILIGDENEHNHALDYYPNQLIYLLMGRSAGPQKLSALHLRARMLAYSWLSFLLTLMQFLLPWLFIGPNYSLYGWNYAKLWLEYTSQQLAASVSSDDGAAAAAAAEHAGWPASRLNSIDYELSSGIFPTSTMCEYKQFGLQGIERAVVQCTVPINEICGKLFAVIWWFVALNIVIEFACFLALLLCSLNFQTIEWTFGRRFWPRAQAEAQAISSFRCRHAELLARLEADAAERRLDAAEHHKLPHHRREVAVVDAQTDLAAPESKYGTANSERSRRQMSDRERKQLEAERLGASDDSLNNSNNNRRRRRRWLLWCQPSDFGLYRLANKAGTKPAPMQMGPARRATSASSRRPPPTDYDEDNGNPSGLRRAESDRNPDLYFLLYLLYLRLNCSRKQVEHVIRLTSEALASYLDRLDEAIEGAAAAASSSASAASFCAVSPLASRAASAGDQSAAAAAAAASIT